MVNVKACCELGKPILRIPENELWTEVLSSPQHSWEVSSGFKLQTHSWRYSGTWSILSESPFTGAPQYNYLGLKLTSPVDFQAFPKLGFVAGFQWYGWDTGRYTGLILVEMTDLNGNIVQGSVLKKKWDWEVFYLTEADLTLVKGTAFDWTKIVKVGFFAESIEPYGGAHLWIDYLYFYPFVPTMVMLTVESDPTNAVMSIDTQMITTPQTVGLEPGVAYILDADPFNEGKFKNWENESTNPEREIIITDDTVVKAFYTPPIPPVVKSILPVFLILGVVGTIIFYRLKK